jgi:hypothetical protein
MMPRPERRGTLPGSIRKMPNDFRFQSRLVARAERSRQHVMNFRRIARAQSSAFAGGGDTAGCNNFKLKLDR